MSAIEDRIVHATLSLINERGLGAVTMVSVADAAGIARQTLYNHYPGVNEIVAAAVRQHNIHSINQLRSALAVVDTPTGTIQQIIRHVAAISTHPSHTLDSRDGLPPDARAELDDFDQELDRQIRQALITGRSGGEFRTDLNVDTDTALVRHILNAISELVANSPQDAPQIVTASTRTTLAALEPRSPQ